MKLFGYLNALRTVGFTYFATYAVAGLSQAGHRSVVAHQKGRSRLTINRILLTFGYIAFVHAFVVVHEYGWYVYSIRARHAIFAVGAGYGGVFQQDLRRFFEEVFLFVG